MNGVKGTWGSLFLMAVCGLAMAADAALMKFPEKSAAVVEGGGLEIPVFPTVDVSVTTPAGEKKATLALSGAGLRQKKVVLIKADVYVAASYLDKAPAGKLTAADVYGSSLKAMQLTFVRNVSASQIRDSFGDALKENGVDIESPPLKALLSQLTFDLPEKSTLRFLAYSPSEKDDLVFVEAGDKKFSVRGPGLAKSLWSMWFGVPVDGGIERLQARLLGES